MSTALERKWLHRSVRVAVIARTVEAFADELAQWPEPDVARKLTEAVDELDRKFAGWVETGEWPE